MTRVFPFLFVLVACAPDVPAQPNWVDDVGPILKANCVRCHGVPSSGGAPLEFRLDQRAIGVDGQKGQYGAQTMAPFIAHRAAVLGDMPPNGPQLTDRQKEILIRWAASEATNSGNSPPTMTLVGPLVDDNTKVEFNYLIDDADGDGVVGSLMVGNLMIDTLHAGRGTVFIDTVQLPTLTYDVTAVISDRFNREAPTDIPAMGTLNVTNANAAPTIQVNSPAPDDIVFAARGLDYAVTINDPEGGPWTTTFEAIRGAEVVELTSTSTTCAQQPCSGRLNTSDLAAAPSWRLRVTVTDDALNTSTVTTERFIVSTTRSMLTYADDIEPIILDSCSSCHTKPTYSGFNLSLTDLQENRGLIWRRVVQKREMPPKSAASFTQARADSLQLANSFQALTEQERAMLSEWLLAGAELPRPPPCTECAE